MQVLYADDNKTTSVLFKEDNLSLKIKFTQRKLEIKQVEFKLGEDCWGIKDQSTAGYQDAALQSTAEVLKSKYCSLISQSTAWR